MVIVKNARHVEFTGKKWEQKLYRWHTGCVWHSYLRTESPNSIAGLC